jgi:hypothetical protein
MTYAFLARMATTMAVVGLLSLPAPMALSASDRATVLSRGAEAPTQGATQRIVLDRSVQAGPWILFPAVPPKSDGKPPTDAELTDYFAVPNSLSLVEVNGKPVFSFVRFVSNAQTGTRGAGGGILVASLQLGPPERQIDQLLEQAADRLRERNPNGKIVGTAIFSDGTFRVISTVKPDATQGGRPTDAPVTRVLGEGRAPVTPGGRVAVHMKLSEEDMLRLWETFKTNAADLSLQFDMNLRGYDTPISAEVFGNWEQIYSHQAFQAKLTLPILQAEIDQAVKEMETSKALRIVGVGEGDEKFNKVVEEVVKLIRDTIFSPIALMSDVAQQTQAGQTRPRSGSEGSSSGSSGSGSESGSGSGSGSISSGSSTGSATGSTASTSSTSTGSSSGTSSSASGGVSASTTGSSGGSTTAGSSTTGSGSATTGAASTPPRPPSGSGSTATSGSASGSATGTTPPRPPGSTAASGSASGSATGTTPPRPPGSTAASGSATGSATGSTPPRPPAGSAAASGSATGSASGTTPPRPSGSGTAATSGANTGSSGSPRPSGGSDAGGGLRIEAQFVMREERQSGELYFSFEKWRPTTIAFPITHTLAGLDRYMDDETIFRTTNLDDTFLQQREIAVILDGARPSDFAEYINFVNVQLRKTHQSGEVTDREVRVDRTNFNQDPTAFRMIYGWRGDTDRTRWQDYEWRPIWSFFGGTQVDEPWRPASTNAITVDPPYDRTLVQVGVLDPAAFEERGVRAAVVDVFYDLGGQEKSVRATVKRGDQPMDRTLDLIRPRGQNEYSYQVVYLLAGGKSLDTGRHESSVPFLFLDDILDMATPPGDAAEAP